MNSPAENMAWPSSDKAESRSVIFGLTTVRRMLPLARHIVDEILHEQRSLAVLQLEQELLDKQRRTLSWPQRSRRYRLREEIAERDESLRKALAELDSLGVVLLDAETGRVGFPTLVNDLQAYFSWQPEDEDVENWHFIQESGRRPIPRAWLEKTAARN